MIVLHVLGNESVIRILILPWARVVDGAPIGAWQLQPANSTTGDPWAGVCRIALVDRDNPHKEVRFAGDSPLEERVSSEPVSEVGFSGLAIRHDSERFMDDNRSGKRLFRARKRRNFSLCPLAASPAISILNC